MSETGPSRSQTPASHRRVAGSAAAVAVLMAGLSYAAVPLYQMFCRATGYGGATQVSSSAPALRGERSMIVAFDANVAPGLPWTFTPEARTVSLRNGETATMFFRVRNNSDRAWTGTAAYNVSPDQAGSYFTKISCFCFEEQSLGPRETAEWPVVFYLDPALEQDRVMAGVESVTLSYTFFASKTQPAVAAAAAGAKPNL